jgi:hypothetical protein
MAGDQINPNCNRSSDASFAALYTDRPVENQAAQADEQGNYDDEASLQGRRIIPAKY